MWTSPRDDGLLEVKEGEDIPLLWEYQADSSSTMVLIKTEDVVIGHWFERQNNFTIYPVFQGRVSFHKTVIKQDHSGFYGEKIELKLMKAHRNDLNVPYTCELVLQNSAVKQKDIRVGCPDSPDARTVDRPMYDIVRPNGHLFRILAPIVFGVLLIALCVFVAGCIIQRRRRSDRSRIFRLDQEKVTMMYKNKGINEGPVYLPSKNMKYGELILAGLDSLFIYNRSYPR
ncbi:hypothetical protein SNE40_007026 [Patella caerulea]|uniref:Uncharacterized protein n=1 Tax=Patella caerulea TaxID=87958 RepID=A0AAN8K531_PATCE